MEKKVKATPKQMFEGIHGPEIDAASARGRCTGFGYVIQGQDKNRAISAVNLGEWLVVPAGHTVKVDISVKGPRKRKKYVKVKPGPQRCLLCDEPDSEHPTSDGHDVCLTFEQKATLGFGEKP
jgi:hypothetical protein